MQHNFIHPKSESPGSPDSTNNLNFPQNYSLRTRKLPTLLCWILSQGAKAVKMCQSVVDYAINVWQTCSWFQTHFSATFLGLFNDLSTFVARFWCRDLRTFSANFSWLKSRLCKLFVCLLVKIYTLQNWNPSVFHWQLVQTEFWEFSVQRWKHQWLRNA